MKVLKAEARGTGRKREEGAGMSSVEDSEPKPCFLLSLAGMS